jgi:hypothetical protein
VRFQREVTLEVGEIPVNPVMVVTNSLATSFLYIYLKKGRAMYVLILLPFLLVTMLAAIFSLVFANPDQVIDDHYSYVDFEPQNY